MANQLDGHLVLREIYVLFARNSILNLPSSMASQRQVLKYRRLSLNILPASHSLCTSYVDFREYYLFRLIYEY